MPGESTLTELTRAQIAELEKMLSDFVKTGDGGSGELPVLLDMATPRHGSHTSEALERALEEKAR